MPLQTVPCWWAELLIDSSPAQVVSQPSTPRSRSSENAGATPLSSHRWKLPRYILSVLPSLFPWYGYAGAGGGKHRRGTTKAGRLYSSASAAPVFTTSSGGHTHTSRHHLGSSGLHTLDLAVGGELQLTGNGLFKMSLLASFPLICSITCTDLHTHSFYIQFRHLTL